MKIIKGITEDQMIAVFLKGETESFRFKEALSSAKHALGVKDSVLTEPDTNSSIENTQRRKVLALYRGFGENKFLFIGFPISVRWVRAQLSHSEVLEVKYTNLDDWNKLSENSRSPSRAAEVIKKSIGTHHTNPYQHFLDMADALRIGAKFPELILVAINEESELVALEGHARLTAYALAPEFISNPLEVIIGFAPDMAQWYLYK